MLPQKNLKSRSSEIQFPAQRVWATKTVLILKHLKISVVVVVVEFVEFFIDIIFSFITDGGKRSYRRR